MNRIRWYGPSLVLLVTVLAVLVAGPFAVRQIAWAQTDAQIQLAQNSLKQNEALAAISDSFRKVAKVVEPSVVHVEVLSRAGRRGNNPLDQLREMLPQWQEREDAPFPGTPGPFNGPPQGQPGPYDEYNRAIPQGNGSGWVYDANGHIITNNHVIANAEQIRVRFQDGAVYEAEVVGTDPSTDVAVLKIDATNLHPVAIAEEQVEPGDIVFAFGSPFGFDFSMSQGIVSAKGRQLHIIDQGYENFIQTDAAINPGNSGGPLTNIYGELVGMNTAIASRARTPFEAGFMGLGFAIPANMVTRVADQIIEGGQVSRGFLGIYIDDLTEKMARSFGFEGEGVLVVSPTGENSPAAAAGVQSGDIITHIDGEPVSDPDALRFRVAGLEPGSEIEVRLFRDGETLTRTVTLGELTAQGTASRVPSPQPGVTPDTEGLSILQKYGISSVETFTPDLAERLNADFQEGVLVTGVRPGSIAEGELIRRGTLITHVQEEAVTTVEELLEQVKQHDPIEGFRLKVSIWNPQDGNWMPRFVFFELPRQ